MHGDIPQKQREITLKGFRNGSFGVLVATNVAARGLDIPEVDLVVQSCPPKVRLLFVFVLFLNKNKTLFLVFGVLKVTSLTFMWFYVAAGRGNMHLSFQYSVFDGLRVSGQPFATLPGCLLL